MKAIFTLNLKKIHCFFDMQTIPCPITILSKRRAFSWFFWFKRIWRISDFLAILFHSNDSKTTQSLKNSSSSPAPKMMPAKLVKSPSASQAPHRLAGVHSNHLETCGTFSSVCFCRGSYCWWFRHPANKTTRDVEIIVLPTQTIHYHKGNTLKMLHDFIPSKWVIQWPLLTAHLPFWLVNLPPLTYPSRNNH